ncbi:sulfotransferase [Maribacter dokdonensis]|uniref:sulfotransferase n=1 Tax=Maribacter dokdonensis TaxID=320912 RepID=UPI0032974322
MKESRTIIYIMSNQRSGSTLIENILSKSPQMVSVGELYLLGGHINKSGPGSAWDWNCSCGASLKDCDFWKNVYEKLNISNPIAIKNTKIDYPKGIDRNLQERENQKVVLLMNQIYETVFNITNCSVLIDSSKEPFHGTSLYKNSSYNFKFIYLKRDLRAVSISRKKWRKKYNKEEMSLFKLLLANFSHRIKCRIMLKNVDKKDVFNLNYEDFFKNPQQTLNDMSSFFGFNSYNIPQYMELNNDHTIAGTPNRFEKRRIKYDDRWHSISKKHLFFNMLGHLLNKIG